MGIDLSLDLEVFETKVSLSTRNNLGYPPDRETLVSTTSRSNERSIPIEMQYMNGSRPVIPGPPEYLGLEMSQTVRELAAPHSVNQPVMCRPARVVGS